MGTEEPWIWQLVARPVTGDRATSGDSIHFGGARWYEVTRVNATLTVKTDSGIQQKAPYPKVTGRRRNGVHQMAVDLLAADLNLALSPVPVPAAEVLL